MEIVVSSSVRCGEEPWPGIQRLNKPTGFCTSCYISVGPEIDRNILSKYIKYKYVM